MWYCGPFFGVWWIFPLMFIACMVMMFVVMRLFLTGWFPCCPHRRMKPGQSSVAQDRENDTGSRG